MSNDYQHKIDRGSQKKDGSHNHQTNDYHNGTPAQKAGWKRGAETRRNKNR